MVALRGVAIFAIACFGHPSPSKRQKLNATTIAFGAPAVLRTCHFATPSYTRCWLRSTTSNDWTAFRETFYFVYTYASASIPTKQRTYAYWGLPALAFALHGWQRMHSHGDQTRCRTEIIISYCKYSNNFNGIQHWLE